MCLLFETIACENERLLNLPWHNARLNASREKLFSCSEPISLDDISVPSSTKIGLWRCRIDYDEKIRNISFTPNLPKTIASLRLVESNLEYQFKFDNRAEIEALYQQRADADEIIIIKNGRVTDTSIANILLFDGTRWITPDTPLLKGTMRQQLIDNGTILVQPVLQEDLMGYQKIMLINALNPFDELQVLDISAVLV